MTLKKVVNHRWCLMNKTEKAPDRILIGEGDREIYERLKKTSFFEGKDNKDIFLMALAWGFHNGQSSPITNKETFFLLNTLEDHERSIIHAIAVYKKDDVEILLNKKEVYNIAQEYGSAGVRLLDEMISDKEEADFVKRLELMLIDEFNNLKDFK